MLQFIRGVQSSLDCISAFSQFIALVGEAYIFHMRQKLQHEQFLGGEGR